MTTMQSIGLRTRSCSAKSCSTRSRQTGVLRLFSAQGWEVAEQRAEAMAMTAMTTKTKARRSKIFFVSRAYLLVVAGRRRRSIGLVDSGTSRWSRAGQARGRAGVSEVRADRRCGWRQLRPSATCFAFLKSDNRSGHGGWSGGEYSGSEYGSGDGLAADGARGGECRRLVWKRRSYACQPCSAATENEHERVQSERSWWWWCWRRTMHVPTMVTSGLTDWTTCETTVKW
jgi:hypothetical protein